MQNLNESISNRNLSSLEYSFEILNQFSGALNTIFYSRIKGKLTESVVRKAIDYIQSRHLYLQSRIVGHPDNLRFETDETTMIPLRVINNHVQWQDVVDEELNKKIESIKV